MGTSSGCHMAVLCYLLCWLVACTSSRFQARAFAWQLLVWCCPAAFQNVLMVTHAFSAELFDTSNVLQKATDSTVGPRTLLALGQKYWVLEVYLLGI